MHYKCVTFLVHYFFLAALGSITSTAPSSFLHYSQNAMDFEVMYPGLTVLKCLSLGHLFTRIRDESTPPQEFRRYSTRLMNLICEESLSVMVSERRKINSPTGSVVEGSFVDPANMIAVPIIRAGDSMLESFMGICPEVSFLFLWFKIHQFLNIHL